MEGKIADLRAAYLFLLAHVCHMSPPQVDATPWPDFAVLLHGIDQWLEAQKAG